jgi:hypothetical protein
MSPVSYRRHLALSHVRKVGLFKTVALLRVGVEPQWLITVPFCVIRSNAVPVLLQKECFRDKTLR